MNVGIEKVSNDFLPFIFNSLKRINSTVGTTDMEEDSHWL
jgi:hypothetical protein